MMLLARSIRWWRPRIYRSLIFTNGNKSPSNYSSKEILLEHSSKSQHLQMYCCFARSVWPVCEKSGAENICHRKSYHTTSYLRQKKEAEPEESEPEKLSLVKRYKKMLKEYWYILIPVHMVTSTLWFGMFYYIAQSGFDIIPYLEMVNLPESIIKPLRNPLLGYIAVASALYKIATPARYMVTLGGSTVTIKYLTKRGLIKPVPTKDKFKSIFKNKLQSSKERGTMDK